MVEACIFPFAYVVFTYYCFSVCSDAPITTGPLWSSAIRAVTPVMLKSSSGAMKRKVSLKLSTAAKGLGLAGLNQWKRGHHLEENCGTTGGWLWTFRLTINTRCPYSNLWGWTVFTVTALVALASFLCVFCCLPSHRGLAILSKGWRVWEEDGSTEMMRCKCPKANDARACQGMN